MDGCSRPCRPSPPSQPLPLPSVHAQPPRARQGLSRCFSSIHERQTFLHFSARRGWANAEDQRPLHPPFSSTFQGSSAFLQRRSGVLQTFGRGSGGESQGKCEFSTSRSVALSSPGGDRPRELYRSESEKKEGLVHLHTSISSPATRWDSVWIRDSLEARNSTARSQTRFMRLLQKGGPGSAGRWARSGQGGQRSVDALLYKGRRSSSSHRAPAAATSWAPDK